jgi:ketosteroid isomerase-like protein
MKRIASALIIICATVCLSQVANEQENRQRILALEHAWDQALQRGDVKALSAIFDDALLYIDFDGKLLTKAEYLLRVRTNEIHLAQVITDEMDVQVFGTTAIVIGTYRAKGTEKGKAYTRHGRFMDTWILNGKNWICIGSTTTPILN